MGREDELFDKYMLIRQMTEAVRNKNMAATGPLGDTTRGRGRVLALLKQKDGISTKDMATIMGIRVSSLNEVLGKMEKEGYVERTASPDDRRVMLVWLTDKGKAIELPDQKLPQILFGTLSQGAQNQLCMHFEQMIASLQGELEEEGEAVKEARAQGDLSENFEYYAAKKHKNQNESRIRYLERMLKTAEVVEDTSRSDEVGMDDIVEVEFEEDGEVEKYKLVTSIRGNSMENRVSIESPIGKALKGHRVGDRVKVQVNENVSYYLRIRSIDKTGDEGEDIRSF